MGWGWIGAPAYVELSSPDDVVERTTKLRARPLTHPPPWSDPTRLPSAVVIAMILSGDSLVWFGSHDRYVRVPVDAAHHPADLGSDLHLALDMLLHLQDSPERVELAAPRR